jgi:hypothetical protein
MPDKNATAPAIAAHGAAQLPSVDVDSYNVELRDDEGFIGDRAKPATTLSVTNRAMRLARKNWMNCWLTAMPKLPACCTAQSRTSLSNLP